jgi:O-succinylbenzoate synthase
LNALLTGDEPSVRAQAERARAQGYRAVKLKVGRERMTEDLRLLGLVREIVGPDTEIRLDANRAWGLDDAVLFGNAAREAQVSYIEEPCDSPFDLPAFHEATGMDYALDESIQIIHELIHQQEATVDNGPFRDLPIVPVVQGAKAIIWKPSIVHSPELGKFLFEEARPGQTRILVLTAAFESGVGTAALASYAAMFSSPTVPVGLDTYRWIAPDVLSRRLPLEEGLVDLHGVYQAGKAVDESRLTRIWPR